MQAGIGTLAVVGTAVYKSWQLSEGGAAGVAKSMGGSRVHGWRDRPRPRQGAQRGRGTRDRHRACAHRPFTSWKTNRASTRSPPALTSKDAVIGVTRGAIDKLKRHQLQGVIAHEFSHIANGDMRLNSPTPRHPGRHPGDHVHRTVLAASGHAHRGVQGDIGLRQASAGHDFGPGLFGMVIWPIGQIGAMFATLIHMAVNRQREFLADASAVQYTRDPQGLCEALAVVLDEEAGSRVHGPAAQLASHMFFASGRRSVGPAAGGPPADRGTYSAGSIQSSRPRPPPELNSTQPLGIMSVSGLGLTQHTADNGSGLYGGAVAAR